ncbi:MULTISPECIES: methyl-accepting chemotaxis protein [Halomonas]|uniref:Methyl-accepting chemotaxis protein II n=2 Tax=Halomonas halophila TaxID=29573 RepID=A0ABQ0U7E0_9GAMM|nr:MULTISPECIES: methyl-accepting chemotaxis protein [Halomonas]MDR5889250.1 methyl-accepting chemotaxis protein [Halomonas salina]WJY07196.1 methyl-accepting chemotaxis protein [Halomonas halophila]GEK74423.1 methyl-accepting chemotaxis protein II [Halomonas halophila]
MTIRFSWFLVLIAFTAIILGTGALGLYANHHGRSAFDTLRDVQVAQSRALNRAYIATLRAQVAMDRAAHLVRVPSFDRPGPILEQAERHMDQAKAAFERFQALPVAESQQEAREALASRFQSLFSTGLSLQLMLLQEGDAGGYDSGQSRVSDMSQAFMDGADAFFAGAVERGDGLAERFSAVAGWLNLALLAALGGALAIVLVVIWGVRANVLRPLSRMIAHFRRIADGDLATLVEARSNNEIGQLYRELDGMRRALATTVARVRHGSDRVLDGAGDMSEGNQELASRTRQQAAALEQTTASLDEMTASVADNATHVGEANRLAEQATGKARQGGEVVADFVATMDDIHARSQRIGEIVGMIDDIAFQTNLLALNASVEAARAGEHGRGFAVVAGEVRSLASRSAGAAREIRDLIEASRSSVERGNGLSRRAGEDMTGIVAAIQGVSERVDQIAHASDEQRQGLEQVNQAMHQMGSVTQRNRDMVERAERTAATLEEEAERMRGFTAGFTLATAEAPTPEDDATEPASSDPRALEAMPA